MERRQEHHRTQLRWWAVLAVAACTPRGEPKPEPAEGGPIADSRAAAVPTQAAPAAPPVAASVSRAAVDRPEDASASSCRALRGPIELPVRGPAVLTARGDHVHAVLDDDGRPRVSSFVVGPTSLPSGPVAREPAAGAATSVFKVPCAIAGDVVFCPDRSGAIHRTTLAGEGDRVVASGRTGTRVAAGAIGATHTVLAYLASRRTSEGWISEAWAEVDDGSPQRLSEDGSGATAVDLAPHGSSLIALTVDARAALTAMHARSVGYEGGLRLGEDAVVFVGGPGDRRTAAVLALPPSGPGWALLPIAKDVSEFGLALVKLDDPPRVDEPTVWSMYPNGLDPAPIAAASGNSRTWVARVRPSQAMPGAARELEVGELAPEGGFIPRHTVPTGDSPSDVGLALDSRGALWISWLDSSGSWVERLICR